MAKNYRKLKLIIFAAVAIALVAAFINFSRKSSQEQKNINISGNNIAPAALQMSDNNAQSNQNNSDNNDTAPAQDQTVPQATTPNQIFPDKYLLPVPFYSQAPLSKWDEFHEEMCEEASVLNAGLYLEGKKLTKDQFEAELQSVQKIEKNDIGAWKSTTVAEIKKLADIYFAGKLQSKTIDNPTAQDIEAEVVAGNPVIVPLSGRDIGNPNFTPPGPVYHMLVVKGYDAQNFITNDVGTRKGDSYIYKKEVIMKNIHDWNEKDIHLGVSRILVLYR